MNCEAQLTATQTGKGEYPENVRMTVQDYLSVAVMLCAALVNTQTDTQADSFWPAILLAAAS